jgi:hypothetical protein
MGVLILVLGVFCDGTDFLGFFGCLWFVEKEAEEVYLSAHACWDCVKTRVNFGTLLVLCAKWQASRRGLYI